MAHELSKLENGPELELVFDNGEIKVGQTNIKVEYGQDSGKAHVLTYNQQRAEIVLNSILPTLLQKNSVSQSKSLII